MSIINGISDKKLIPKHNQKFGLYKHNNLYYTNKFRALAVAGSDYITWDYRDDEWKNTDFTDEPVQDLYDIYAARAWQLRQKYDNIILLYSGGIDSTVMLRAFVDNNVPIDCIIVNVLDKTATYSDLADAEQIRVAFPYIKQLEQEKNIKLPVVFQSIIDDHRNWNEDWMFSGSCNLQPNAVAATHSHQGSKIKKILNKGTTAAIKGNDKPRLVYENGKWYVAFLDVAVGAGGNYENMYDTNFLEEEWFYWDPDASDIIKKQAHIIIDEFEKHFTSEDCEKKFPRNNKFDKVGYGNLIEPIIYGKYLRQEIGSDRTYFYLPPSFSQVIGTRSWWFFNAKDEFKKENELFSWGINKLKQTIDPMHFNKTKGSQHDIDELLKHCPIDPDIIPIVGDTTPLFGTVGCWSPFYYVRDYGKKSKQELIDSTKGD